MVKQQREAKTSSRNKRGSEYELPSYVTGGGFLPITIQTVVGLSPSTGEPGYFAISGTLYPDGLSEAEAQEKGISNEAEALANLREVEREQWLDPPHIAFANLRVNDSRSVEAFIRRYGVLHLEGRRGFLHSGDSTTRVVLPQQQFRIESPEVEEEQLHLRAAWETAVDSSVKGAFPLDVTKVKALEGLEVHDLLNGIIQIKAKDLLTLVSFLFLRDSTTGKLGICANPDCLAPYFRKKRTTQKYCERGPCVQYAQRQYSLDWWNREGKKRREKKSKVRRK
jgi:hypothetical protein